MWLSWSMEKQTAICAGVATCSRHRKYYSNRIIENKEKLTSGVLHGDRWPLHQKEAGETCDGGGDF